MTRFESAARRELFAKLIFDVGQRLTKREVCERVGITERTYERWSNDPSLSELIMPESWRVTETTRLYVSAHRPTAVRTLVDVMENSPNDNARVNAAKVFLEFSQKIEEPTENDATMEVARILATHRPLLVSSTVSTVNVLQVTDSHGPPTEEADEVEDDVIEGDYTPT